MPYTIKSQKLPGVFLIEPGVFQDDRGFFLEVFRSDQFRELGLPDHFVQENHSGSHAGVLRGLHFQWQPPMGKLMRVTRGAAFLVAVDIRIGSPTLGQWHGCEVSESNRLQIWAPAGFARGFCALTDFTEVQYLCTGTYNAKHESGILWSDPEIGINWPIQNPNLSEKDRTAQTFAQWRADPRSQLVRF